MNFLSLNTVESVIYNCLAAAVFLCIGAILFMAVYFGRRAKRNVKKETVKELPRGFSPLDVQRIFIGKTYPRKLTAALLTHWAALGHIKLKYIDKYHVKVIKIKNLPPHDSDKAVFFDRGTYVREIELFKTVMNKTNKGDPVDLRRPLFTKNEAATNTIGFAVREDVGVYSTWHYTLKIITIVLSVLPFLISAIWCGIASGNYMGILMFFMALIGLSVLKFVKEMPILFKFVWCGMWLGASVGSFIGFFIAVPDPYGICYASVAIMFAGIFVLIRFIDFREKNNLDDYSDLVNYRKFLTYSPASELQKLDYGKVLPFLYAFGIKAFVKRKYHRILPDYYTDDPEGKGALL